MANAAGEDIANRKSDKIVFKIFDGKAGGDAKRPHNCNICQIYKREISKGNTDALRFYRDHINEVVKKYKGATIIIDRRQSALMLAAGGGN